MRFLFSAIALLATAFVGGCDKDANDCKDCVLLGYAQTRCSDPWGYGADGSTVAVEYAVRDFFASRGVVVDEVSIYGTTEPVINCSACNCPTGQTIYVSVNAADSATLTSLGFFK